MTLQSQEEHRAKERGNKFLRYGARTPIRSNAKHTVHLRGRRAGNMVGAKLVFALLTLMLSLSVPSHAQTAPVPAAPIITGPPKVLILVYQQPGGADQVSITYDPKVSQAQAAADIDALTQATGWPISSRSITEAPSPLTNRPGAMTSVTFAVPGAVQDSSHTFPVEVLARVFRRYKRLNAVFIVGPQFQFQGARSYADNDIKVALDQHGSSYVYQIEVLSQNFSRLPLAPGAGNAAAHRSPWGILLGVIGAAALVGIAVYLLTARLSRSHLKSQHRPDDTNAEAETRLEAGTRK